MKNTIRFEKGKILPHQDFLEIELSSFLMKSSIGKTYTEKDIDVVNFKEKHKGHITGYYFNKGDGVFLLEDDYEITVRKVSKKRLEKESLERIKERLNTLL